MFNILIIFKTIGIINLITYLGDGLLCQRYREIKSKIIFCEAKVFGGHNC